MNTEYVVRINGQQITPEDASISIFDHGFLFGDSIYEVVQTVDGSPFAWEEHLARLRNSASRLSMDLPWSDSQLRDEIDNAVDAKTWQGESYVRVIITRGVGRIALLPTSCVDPALIIIAKEIPKPGPKTDTGLVICLTKVRRNSRLAMDPGIKSGNYLNNVLAAIEANEMGADDALMLNETGHLTECTTSNIYLVKDGRILTPSLESGILDGITRMKVREVASNEGIHFIEGEYSVGDLESADEIFMTGTVKGVVPVCRINGTAKWQGDPGPVTDRLRKAYIDFAGVV